ncbi:patatin-like phospholipase domain-containing protein [Kibdelosporangium aridum]|uniref:PNPLA domain-containing protein n=1 Tax=Kibdelosporangium aridum TaxID=2030 RepID=A0A1Y5X1Y4_KIBAR|nr:hypothetical protein [Kibdelosporangium aridum]SMC65588.1 hypothetical protein SAMN05661093_01190 [Kibdelosporangium aridum]
MVDVGLATAAAPVYFQAADVDQTRLIDGGVWANNPSVVAITEAYSMLGVPFEKMRILNIGTMGTVTDHSPRLHNAGILRWDTAAISGILTASSRSSIGTARHLVGFDRFVRFDVDVPPKRFTLDTIDAKQVAAYAGEVGRQFSPAFTEKFAGHRATAYEPLKTHVTRLKP